MKQNRQCSELMVYVKFFRCFDQSENASIPFSTFHTFSGCICLHILNIFFAFAGYYFLNSATVHSNLVIITTYHYKGAFLYEK